MRSRSRRPCGPRAHAARCLALGALLVAGATACATTVAGIPISIPFPDGRTTRPPRGRAPDGGSGGGAGSAVAPRVLATADRYVGTPYRWGGTSPRTGFDCSGYVQYVFRREGVELPRTSRQQAAAGAARATRWESASPGDLVMFANPGEAISHVALYVGGGRILHSSSSGGGVRYDDLDSRRGSWYRRRLVAVRRVSARGPAIARGLLDRLGLARVPLDPPDTAPAPR